MTEQLQAKKTGADDPLSDIAGLIERTNKPDASAADIRALRQLMADNPQCWRMGYNLAEKARDAIIDNFAAVPIVKEDMRFRAMAMKDDLGWRDSGPLEQLLIDAIIVCWLHYYSLQHNLVYIDGRSHNPSEGEYTDKRLSRAHGRLMRSIEALAKVRRLARRSPELLGDFSASLAM